MTKLWKNVSVLGAVGMALGMSGLALGATGTGPYYATPSWDQKLPSDTRFIVLTNWNSEAVLDRETGLVWEQAQSSNPTGLLWANAQSHCNNKVVGSRKGWRLPTVQEVASLIDPTRSNPALPLGHPFSFGNVNALYWTATTLAPFPTAAWMVDFGTGNVEVRPKDIVTLLVWCVRGGQGSDPQ